MHTWYATEFGIVSDTCRHIRHILRPKGLTVDDLNGIFMVIEWAYHVVSDAKS